MNHFLARVIDHAVFNTFHWSKVRRSHHYTDLAELPKYQQRIQSLSQAEFFYTEDSFRLEEFRVSKPYMGFGGSVRDFTLPTANSGPWPENNLIFGRIYEGHYRPTGVIVLLHGWLSFSYFGYRSIARRFNRWGLDTVIVELPHHMRRRPAESAYSGEFALSGDLVRTIESFRQAVGDSHRLVRALRALYDAPVGVWGVSLGAWVASMLCTLPNGPEAAVLVAPPTDPHEMLLRSPVTVGMRRDVRLSGMTLDAANHWNGRLAPAKNPPATPPRRIMIVRPEEDQAVPRSIVEDLHRAWPDTVYLTYPHGHISILACKQMLSDSGQFLSRSLRHPPSSANLENLANMIRVDSHNSRAESGG